jgi:hypothetical protein
MSYANPIDTRIVQVVLDDLEDNNFHALCDLLAYAYNLPRNLPGEVLDEAYERAKDYLVDYRVNRFSAGMVPCPKHEGAYDCTPFCEVCEGDQETAVAN